MEPADSQLRKLATRLDLIVGVITAVIVAATVAWLVILLF